MIIIGHRLEKNKKFNK